MERLEAVNLSDGLPEVDAVVVLTPHAPFDLERVLDSALRSNRRRTFPAVVAQIG